MRVCVLGLGYVGLPTAALLATRGHAVHGVEIDAALVESINAGRFASPEPDLDLLVKSAVGGGRLTAATAPAPADVFLIAVPTPVGADKRPDLSCIEAAARAIAPLLAAGNLVIVESTVPVGATETTAALLGELRGDLAVARRGEAAGKEAQRDRVSVAHCPERVLPGRLLQEIVENDRIVGGIDELSSARARAFYGDFVHGEILATDSRTAELAKLAENAFRDVNIAFANELARVSDALDIDVWRVVELANHHPRVDILRPGPGVGGHCIAVDPWFIAASAPDAVRLIPAAREVNDATPARIADKIRARAEVLAVPVIAALGLSFKADVDDLRNSPALEVVARLVDWDGEILVVEPHVEALPAELAAAANLCLVDLEEALDRAELVALLVDHRDFRALDPARLAGKSVIDTRGVWRSECSGPGRRAHGPARPEPT